MGIQAPVEVKFRLIQEAISQDNNVLSVSNLCRIAGVSRSGYYAWLDAAPAREKRENQDQADFRLILEAYRFRGYAKGARSIHMRLLHQNIIMNIHCRQLKRRGKFYKFENYSMALNYSQARQLFRWQKNMKIIPIRLS